MDADLIAEVAFYRTEDGGRKGPTPPNKFGCLVRLGTDYCDCRLYLDGTGALRPGQLATVPLKFLSSDIVRTRLGKGDVFHLWEGKDIAEAKVLDVFW